MGRGGQDFEEILFGSGDVAPLSDRAIRTQQSRSFIDDLDEWKRQEKQFVDGVIEDLNKAVKIFAGSDQGWAAYLRLYAQTPDYSAFNNLWARFQLRRKDVEPKGLVLSESAWRALGRRIKANYARPEARRDRRFSYAKDREWDDRYCVEMMQPLGRSGFEKKLVDAAGKPILDATGKQKTTFIPMPPKGFKTFHAYHEKATEDIKGGKAKPLPESPWAEATGSDEDARALLEVLEERVVGIDKIEIHYDLDRPERDLNSKVEPAPAARWNETERVISVDSKAPVTEQATAALRCVCEAVGDDLPARNDADRLRRRASIESAKYVIASLYGLDTDQQTFPHLADIADESEGLRKLAGDIHRRVGKILGRIDPRMRDRAREQGRERASRATRRKSQAKKKAVAA